MRRFAEYITPFIESLGGPGLALVAFFDSSFLSLPEICDVLIVFLVIQHPALWWYYAASTTVGSMAGCWALYAVGKKGGETFLNRRFRATHIARGLAAFKRFGMLAIIVPSMLPPPMPFKIFVLVAGVSGVQRRTFLTAVLIGRGFRYTAIALLAKWYGVQARDFIKDNLPQLSMWLAGVIVAGAVAYFVWRRFRTPAAPSVE